VADARLPPGISGIHVLPADHHNGAWDSILVPPGTKERLLGTAVLVLRHGRDHKVVLAAVAQRPELAADPACLTADDLLLAAEAAAGSIPTREQR
jgi:hypothetical protein